MPDPTPDSMSDPAPSTPPAAPAEPAASSTPAAAAAASPKQEDRVILVSYPKIVFLYPTLIMALIAWITMCFASLDSTTAHVVAWLFLFVLGTNAAVISFDFPRSTSLTLFFIGMALVLAFALVTTFFKNVLPFVADNFAKIQPTADATFYAIVFAMLAVIYVFVLINRKFDYWEVKPNELLHHHGLMSDLERFSAPSLKIDKEINDVFEFLLLGSGRLILHPSNAPRAIVLENVLRINRKETEITRMLSALQVQVREA